MPDIAASLAILPAARSDSAAAAQILADAFANDEHTVGLVPAENRPDRLRRLFAVMVSESFAAGGHVWLAVDTESRTPLGVALWEAPSATAPIQHKLVHALSYARVFGSRLLDAARTDHVADAHRPGVPHWYLKDLGTAPEARGTGVGSALLKHRLAAADATGTGSYLESSSRANVGYYRRFGFVERSEIPAVGTSDLIGMWRGPTVPS